MTTLESTTLDYGSAGAGSHPGAETVLALAAANVWLISAFHKKRSRSGMCGGARLRTQARLCQRGESSFIPLQWLPRPRATPLNREKFAFPAKQRVTANVVLLPRMSSISGKGNG